MKVVFIFCFITIIIYAICPFWDLNFFPPKSSSVDPKPNILNLKKGRYLNVTIKATLTNQFQKHKVTYISLLTESQQYFTMTKEKYLIDTKEAMEVTMFIGVPYQSKTLTDYPLVFDSSASDDFYVSKVMISSSDPVPYSITLFYQPLGLIPNSYGKAFLIKPIFNIDPIKVTVKNEKPETEEYYSMDDFTIAPYKETISNEKQAIATYSLQKINPNSNEINFTFSTDSSFFTIQNILNLYQKIEPVPNVKDLILNIIKTTKLNRHPQIKELIIHMNIAIPPTERFCVVVDMMSAFIQDKDIMERTQPEIMTKLRYTYDYIEKKSVKIIKLGGLSHHIPYKMKCIFQTPMITESTQISMTFGLFEKADVKVPIEAEIFEPTPAHCITWIFEVKDPESAFMKKALDYCNDYFTSSVISKNSNGCLECVSRDASRLYDEVTEIQGLESICIKSSDNCNSYFKGDFIVKVDSFKESLSTATKINEKLGLKENQYQIKSIFIEDDTNQPDLSKLIINPSDITIGTSALTFKIYNLDNRKIGCYFMISKQSTIAISSYELINNDIHIPDIGNPKKTIEVKFSNSDWDEQLYNLIMMCYNIPYFDYNFKYREIKTIIQFTKSQSPNPIKTNPLLPLNCSVQNNKERAEECQTISHHSLFKLNGVNPYVSDIALFKEYVQKSFQDKKKSIASLINEASSQENLLTKLNQCLTINDIIETTNCRNEIDYNDCIKFKKTIIRDMMKIPYQLIGNSQIIENITKSNKPTQEERLKEINSNIKLSLMIIFYLINNPDSFDLESTKMLFDMIKAVDSNLDALLSKTSDELERKDLILIIAQYLSNFSDILKFNELEGLYDKEINKETFLVKNQLIHEYVTIINNHSDKLITFYKQGNDSNILLDKLSFKMFKGNHCIHVIL